jgi:hypothetical protein
MAVQMAQYILHYPKKSQAKRYEPLARMGIALVERQAQRLTAALEAYLVIFKRLARRGEYMGTYEGMMCFEGMAFLVLAQHRQVPVTINSPYLFLDLLE